MITGMSTQFSDLTLQEREFIVDWMRKNFVPVARVSMKYAAEAGFLKQPFSRLYFYVTKEQFSEAMRQAGFLIRTKGDATYFNVGKRSQAYAIYGTKGEN